MVVRDQGAPTLLDHHLATFDGWLQRSFMPSPASQPSPQSLQYYLIVITLLEELDLKEHNWRQLPLILQGLFTVIPDKLFKLFGGTKTNIEFSQIVSKFLMDQDRARSFWVNSQKYADLVRHILEFIHDK